MAYKVVIVKKKKKLTWPCVRRLLSMLKVWERKGEVILGSLILGMQKVVFPG